MDNNDTLPEILRPLMQVPTIRLERCAICGRPSPLNQHHIVRRGAGELFKDGVAIHKPTITLCGFGNHLRDDNGRYYCHGLAHYSMLHFRVKENHLEYMKTVEPASYDNALKMRGWKRVYGY